MKRMLFIELVFIPRHEMVIYEWWQKEPTKKMNMYAKRRNNMGVPLKNLLFDSNKFHKYKMLKKPHFYVDHSKSVFPIRYFWKRYCKNKLKSIHILKKKKKPSK